jgi:hypothetical protein
MHSHHSKTKHLSRRRRRRPLRMQGSLILGISILCGSFTHSSKTKHANSVWNENKWLTEKGLGFFKFFKQNPILGPHPSSSLFPNPGNVFPGVHACRALCRSTSEPRVSGVNLQAASCGDGCEGRLPAIYAAPAARRIGFCARFSCGGAVSVNAVSVNAIAYRLATIAFLVIPTASEPGFHSGCSAPERIQMFLIAIKSFEHNEFLC